jgi:hypothetical protein
MINASGLRISNLVSEAASEIYLNDFEFTVVVCLLPGTGRLATGIPDS